MLRLAGQSASVDGEFTMGRIEVDGRSYAFRRLVPLPEARLQPQPLVVFLHGAGERGTENLQQLAWLPRELAQPANRQRFPCHVLAVQCPPGESWGGVGGGEFLPRPLTMPPAPAMQAVVKALDAVLAEPGVDPARVYLTGLSMGGIGAWELAARDPERFAALLPVCGAGEPGTVHRLIGLPTLVYHGAMDDVVPVGRSRQMVGALRDLGIVADYRELVDVRHDAWKEAYRADTGIAWMFAQDQRQQQRGAFAVPPFVPSADAAVVQPGFFELQAGARCVCPRAHQATARLLLDALDLPPAMRPGLVADAEVRRGDLVFAVDPALGPAFAIEVGDAMHVVARDAGALVHAAAAARQALHTMPGHRCPRGRFVRERVRSGGAVEFRSPTEAPADTTWSTADLVTVIRECWSYGADILRIDGLDRMAWLDEADRERVRAEAARHGVHLGVPEANPVGENVVVFEVPVTGRTTWDVASLLTMPLPTAAGPCRFVLRMPGFLPTGAVRLLPTHLPAAAERADRAERSVHVGSFLSRLGQLLRS